MAADPPPPDLMTRVATHSLTLGIFAVFFSLAVPLSMALDLGGALRLVSIVGAPVTALVALALGLVARGKGRRGHATLGIALGGAVLFVAILVVIALLFIVEAMSYVS